MSTGDITSVAISVRSKFLVNIEWAVFPNSPLLFVRLLAADIRSGSLSGVFAAVGSIRMASSLGMVGCLIGPFLLRVFGVAC